MGEKRSFDDVVKSSIEALIPAHVPKGVWTCTEYDSDGNDTGAWRVSYFQLPFESVYLYEWSSIPATGCYDLTSIRVTQGLFQDVFSPDELDSAIVRITGLKWCRVFVPGSADQIVAALKCPPPAIVWSRKEDDGQGNVVGVVRVTDYVQNTPGMFQCVTLHEWTRCQETADYQLMSIRVDIRDSVTRFVPGDSPNEALGHAKALIGGLEWSRVAKKDA